MNKAQRITTAITLLIMAFSLIYPPAGEVIAGQGVKIVLTEGRNLIFSIQGREKIDITNLIVELLSTACLGASITILLSLKKKK